MPAADVVTGTPIQVRVAMLYPFYGQQVLAWVDWNDNKTFDAGEGVYTSSIGVDSQYVFNITPSIGTSLGLKRLRIRMHFTGYSGYNPNATPCGNSGYGEVQDFSLNVISGVFPPNVPAQPSVIGGNLTPCQGTTGLIYSVTNIVGVSYSWTLPTGWIISNGQGTNSITVTAGTTAGNITVTPTNSCGNGIARSMALTTSSAPSQPSVIE